MPHISAEQIDGDVAVWVQVFAQEFAIPHLQCFNKCYLIEDIKPRRQIPASHISSKGPQHLPAPMVATGASTGHIAPSAAIHEAADIGKKNAASVPSMPQNWWEAVLRSLKWNLSYEHVSILSMALFADLHVMPLNPEVVRTMILQSFYTKKHSKSTFGAHFARRNLRMRRKRIGGGIERMLSSHAEIDTSNLKAKAKQKLKLEQKSKVENGSESDNEGPKATQLGWYSSCWKSFVKDTKVECHTQQALDNPFLSLIHDLLLKIANKLMLVYGLLLYDDLATWRSDLKKIIISITSLAYGLFPPADIPIQECATWVEAAATLSSYSSTLELIVSLFHCIFQGLKKNGNGKCYSKFTSKKYELVYHLMLALLDNVMKDPYHSPKLVQQLCEWTKIGCKPSSEWFICTDRQKMVLAGQVCAEIDRENSTVVNWLVGTKLYIWGTV
ncbi:hypothetical protein EV702DRAFT_1044781 [Suillus placidus]|uniref:Uncharacterized protein n=1 Tax=Suillus placidus TaxID=48579 RepID=A0A9P7D3T6_9AGAM|nr:hypothetical protein EV702DRAFT_1044781 [Suillus placidus]